MQSDDDRTILSGEEDLDLPDELIEGRLLRRAPRATTAEVQLAKKRMFFDPGKARAELGLPQTPVDDGLAEAVGWFREHGYA